MGKHNDNEYLRPDRDHYPTPDWVTAALGEFVRLDKRVTWEPAAGANRMGRALAAQGAKVFASDIEPLHPDVSQFDFLTDGLPSGLERFDLIATNPPYGLKNRVAVAFIETGLRRLAEDGGMLALLLSTDFDSAVTRSEFFRNPFFCARVILTARPIWFERTDGEREAPKENVCWYVWQCPILRFPPPPLVFYAQSRPPKKARGGYDAHDDISNSVKLAFNTIRARKAAGGPGWINGGEVPAGDRIIPIRHGGPVEERITVYSDGRLELHFVRRGTEARDQWVDLEYVKNHWPEIASQVEAALAELGAL